MLHALVLSFYSPLCHPSVAANTQLYNNNLNSSYIFELTPLLAGRFVYMNFFYKMESYRLVYDIYSDRYYTIGKGRKPIGITNDLKHAIPFWPSWTNHNKIIGVIPTDFIEENESDAFCLKLKSFDNPVLQIGYY